MLGAAKRLHTSALIPFIPRQVMLELHSIASAEKEDKNKKEKEAAIEKKKKKRSSEALEDVSAAPETLELDRPNGGSSSHKGKGREVLLSSIGAYLESNGFSKTLAVFRSEAQLAIDGWKTSVLNLEDLFCKFLESSKSYADTGIDWPKEQDLEKVFFRKNDECENMLDASEHSQKKKRKKSKGVDGGTETEIDSSTECINTAERISIRAVNVLQVKSKEMEANKLASEGCSAGKTGTFGDKNLKESKTSDEKPDFKKFVSVENSHAETKDKKKKKKLISDSLGTEKRHSEGIHGTENTCHENQLPNDKKRRKKKHKMVCDPCDENTEHGDNIKSQEMVEETIEEVKSLTNNSTQSAESKPKHKDEKKKKTKMTSDSLSGNAEQLELEASQDVINKKSNDALDNTYSKSKDKKKKRGRPTSKGPLAVSSEQLDGGTSHDGNEGYATGCKVKDILQKCDSAKENALLYEENIDNEKISKKRKRLTSEERASQAENEIVTKESKLAKMEGAEDINKETGTCQKHDKSLPDSDYSTIHKKRKTEKCNENSTVAVKTSSSEQLNVVTEHKENPRLCDSQKEAEGHQVANGKLEKESEGGTSSKAVKKEKRSAEPKTVNAFQRVKIDEVEFTDERLQNNSYWAKDGAENGYGAKAQEILGQVRGRDFRHEKTKKKRGSYRGGQIDLQSHSIKFSYSDEE